MATVWIGDFRTRQIQNYINKLNGNVPSTETETENAAETISSDNDYLVENFAECTWFGNNALSQLAVKSVNNSNVVIMLGFIDCIYSCVWEDSFNIDEIAKQYISTIKELTNTFSNSTFYVCSVNPVTADYPFTTHENHLIPKDVLNKKITSFNKHFKDNALINYIDSYSYFNTANLLTRDGAHYTSDTCEYLKNYVTSNFKARYSVATSVGNFTPRTEAPSTRNKYYYSTDNPFQAAGYGMPNCTAYAWGRFYEILGERPNLSTADARNWFGYNKSNKYYSYSESEPQPGAVICWSHSDANESGHVGIVEWVNEDKTEIITSESGWGDSRIWWRKKRTINSSAFLLSKGTKYYTSYEALTPTGVATGSPNEYFNYASGKYVKIDSMIKMSDNYWGSTSYYPFQGFIYNPAVTVTASMALVDKTKVISKNESLTQEEMEINAKYIWNYLGSKGWSLNAVAGMLGNMQHESTINPGRHEIGGVGFGLVQWTPPSNLTNWCDKQNPKLAYDDIDSQLKRIIWEKDNGTQYYKNYYKYTFEDFSVSTDSPYTLACAFAFDYERSAVVLWGANSYEASLRLTAAQKEANREKLRKDRGGSAEKWYKFLSPYSPGSVALSDPVFSVNNFKIDTLSPTSASASFVACKGKSGYYQLFDSNNKLLVKKPVNVIPKDSENTVSSVITFKTSLIPNKSYKLALNVTAGEGGEKIDSELEFKTPQDLPESVSHVKLTAKDSKLPHDSFLLETTPISNWGHWKTTDKYGYVIQLIVNSKVVKEKTVEQKLSEKLEFTLSKYFKYKSAVGDNIQIGIRTWVETDKGETIFDSDSAKMSNSICMLKQPMLAYLNID